MNKKQKCSLSSNINENPILSLNSTIDIKEDSSSTLNHTTIVNDNVPNWIQSGGQVRSISFLLSSSLVVFFSKRIFVQHQI
jgi:hypothetical protein